MSLRRPASRAAPELARVRSTLAGEAGAPWPALGNTLRRRMLGGAAVTLATALRLNTWEATRSASSSSGSSLAPTASLRCRAFDWHSSQLSPSGDLEEPHAHLRCSRPLPREAFDT